MYQYKRTFPKVDKDKSTILPTVSFAGVFDIAMIKIRF